MVAIVAMGLAAQDLRGADVSLLYLGRVRGIDLSPSERVLLLADLNVVMDLLRSALMMMNVEGRVLSADLHYLPLDPIRRTNIIFTD